MGETGEAECKSTQGREPTGPGEDMSAPSLQGFKRGRKALKDMELPSRHGEVQVVLKTPTHHESQVRVNEDVPTDAVPISGDGSDSTVP